jgi:hypothetical protein
MRKKNDDEYFLKNEVLTGTYILAKRMDKSMKQIYGMGLGFRALSEQGLCLV